MVFAPLDYRQLFFAVCILVLFSALAYILTIRLPEREGKLDEPALLDSLERTLSKT